MTARVVALLRGVNVGGHRKIRMADLRAALTDAGFVAVSTYLASGNVAFDTSLALEEAGDAVADVVSRQLGIGTVDVITRSTGEISQIVKGNPWPGADTADMHVIFLGEPAHSRDYAALDLEGYQPEQLVPGDGHVWLRLPGGVGRSPLAKDLSRLLRDSPAGTSPATMRNWRTVCALRSL